MLFKITISLLIGIILGLGIMVLLIFALAPKMMIVEDPSRYDFDNTVQNLVDAAKSKGWSVPIVHQMHDSIAKIDVEVRPAATVELCKPQLAAQILGHDSSRIVTSMMPCRIGVYERADGQVVVSRMNTGLVSRLFGGLIATVMSQATDDSEAIIASVI